MWTDKITVDSRVIVKFSRNLSENNDAQSTPLNPSQSNLTFFSLDSS